MQFHYPLLLLHQQLMVLSRQLRLPRPHLYLRLAPMQFHCPLRQLLSLRLYRLLMARLRPLQLQPPRQRQYPAQTRSLFRQFRLPLLPRFQLPRLALQPSPMPRPSLLPLYRRLIASTSQPAAGPGQY